MSDVTRLLSAIDQGDPKAAGQLLPLVYGELRRLAASMMAREAPGQTVQATALVHDAYLRLLDGERRVGTAGPFLRRRGRGHARILVERARHKQSLKAGGGRRREELPDIELADGGSRLRCWPSTRP